MFKKLLLFWIIFYFITTPLIATETNFKFIKNPYTNIIPLSDYNRLEKENIRAKGIASVFYWNDGIDNGNDIYVTFRDRGIDDYPNILQIKKLNKEGTGVDNFITITIDDYKKNISDYAACVVHDKEYVYFFYTNVDGNKFTAKKVSLRTKAIDTFSDNLAFVPIDAVAHNDYIYILACNDIYLNPASTNNTYFILCFNIKNMTINKVISVSTPNFAWNSLVAVENKIFLYGRPRGSSSYMTTTTVNISNSTVGDVSYYTVNDYEGIISLSGKRSFLYQSAGETFIYTTIEGYNTHYNVDDSTGVFFGYILCDTNNTIKQHKIFEKLIQPESNGSLYIDNTGAYFGYSISDFNHTGQMGFYKRSVNGLEPGTPERLFLVDNNIRLLYNVRYVNEAMLVANVNGYNKILTIASIYHNYPYSPQTVLYSVPVDNNYPNAFFTEESGFENSVLSPKMHQNNYGNYEFRFKYVNYQNKAPTNNPVIYLYNNGELVKSDGYTMNPADYSDTNYTDGVIYNYTLTTEEIGQIKQTDNYSYKIQVGDSISEEYFGPFFYPSNPTIEEYDDGYIYPKEINSNDEIFVQITYSDKKGIDLLQDYPRVIIYNNNDLTTPIEINGNTHTVLSKIEDSENGYKASIGQLPAGKYTYKIIVQNEFEFETVVTDTFEVKKLDNNICFNAPNPFNPNKTTTTIRFNCNNPETVTIKIYSLNGKIVFKDTYDAVAGTNDYIYKGKDGNGNSLYNGVYLCVVEKKEGNVKCKIAIVK